MAADRPITPPQSAFIRKLAQAKLAADLAAIGATVDSWMEEHVASLTVQGASKLISALKDMADPVTGAVECAHAADTVEGRQERSKKVIVNRMAAPCVVCHNMVAGGEGRAILRPTGGWDVVHPTSADCAALPVQPAPTAKEVSLQDVLADVEPGFYAVPSLTGNNDLDFFVVKVNKGFHSPERKGEKYILRIVGGNDPIYPSKGEQCRIAQVLAALTPEAALAARELYGQSIGSCGDCGRSLTDQVSRERGIGPDCWSRRG